MNKKAAYKKPLLSVIGTVQELTLGSDVGAVSDADFPTGTPKGYFTFS